MSGEHRIPVGPLVALLGALLLVVSLFLDWYEGLTGWTVFELVDLVLVGLALWTVVSLAGGFGVVKSTSNPPAALIGAVVALVIVVTQLINDPPAVAGGARDHDIGIWLALAGAALMVAGAVLATTRISLAVESRRRDAEREEPTAPMTRTGPPPERSTGGPERP